MRTSLHTGGATLGCTDAITDGRLTVPQQERSSSSIGAAAILWAVVCSSLALSVRSPATSVAIFGMGCAAILGLASRSLVLSIRRNFGCICVGSVFASAFSIAVVLPPAVTATVHGTYQKLDEVSVFPPAGQPVVGQALELYGVCLASFFLLESLVRPGRVREASDKLTLVRRLAVVGLAVSLLGVLSRSQSLQARGTIQGQGVLVLLGWTLPLFVAVFVLVGDRTTPYLWVAAVLGVVVLAGEGTRSPLLLIITAICLRGLGTLLHRRLDWRLLASGLASLWTGIALSAGMSQWRGDLRLGLHTSLLSDIASAATNPIMHLQGSGLDTFDGLVSTRFLNFGAAHPSPADLSKAITGFIPHQLWSSKPDWFINIVAHDIFAIKGNGFFLSGPGYLSVIFSSGLVAVILFAVLGGASAWVCRKRSLTDPWTLLWVYFVVRFFMEGDAFDMFHVFGLGLVIVAVSRFSSRKRHIGTLA